MTHYGMVIDLKRCFGCQTCAVACKTSNNLPREVWYNRVSTGDSEYSDVATGTFPNLEMTYVPKACQHCEEPACVEVCPTGATFMDDNGIVQIDAEACIGCKSCMTACPYDVRVLIEEEPAYYVDGITVGDPTAPKHVGGTVEKCNFCSGRIAEGRPPACMELCPGRARYWGDLDDPDSDVSKAKEMPGREVVVLSEESGTKPSVFYLK